MPDEAAVCSPPGKCLTLAVANNSGLNAGTLDDDDAISPTASPGRTKLRVVVGDDR